MTTEQIWEQFGDALRRFIRNRVADDSQADDVLQEVFLRIHRGLASLTDHERIAPWAFRIARNTIVDHIRRTKNGTALLRDVDVSEGESWEPIRREFGEGIAALARTLPPHYRDAVVLAEIEGVTQQQTAERLGLSLSGAKSRVQRGRNLLRELVEQCCRLTFDPRGNLVDWEPHGSCGSCEETMESPPKCCGD